MQAVLLFLLSLLTLTLASPFPVSNATAPAVLRKATDDDLFVLSLDDFITKRNAQDGPSGLDWTSDGCSYALNDPLGFNFLKACQRHDFGYRNYKKQGRFNATTKPVIDTNFRKDMTSLCKKGNHFVELCKDMAGLYYEAVRFLGSKREAAILKAQAQIQKAQAEALKARDSAPADAQALKTVAAILNAQDDWSGDESLAEILDGLTEMVGGEGDAPFTDDEAFHDGPEGQDEVPESEDEAVKAQDEMQKARRAFRARLAFRRAPQNVNADQDDEKEKEEFFYPADSDRDGDFLEGEASEGKGYVSTDNQGPELSDWDTDTEGGEIVPP